MQQATGNKKIKFATQADPEILASLRSMASQEGRQLQALVDEAFRDYIIRKQGSSPRKKVADALQSSMVQYDALYRELAK